MLLFFVAIGLPLSWHKSKGGTQIDWIGYSLLLEQYALGVTERRAQWAIQWLEADARDGTTELARFASSIGRLSFMVSALEYERPFVAPLYSFQAMHRRHGIIQLPLYVRIVMRHIAERLRRRRYYPSAQVRHRCSDGFRVDAQASAGRVGVGGWLPKRDARGTIDIRSSPWFALELTPVSAPWALARGQPYRAIASLEAMATLLGCIAVCPPPGLPQDTVITIPGTTDNQGNRYALTRLQSNKFPLCAIVMELSAQLEARSQRLELLWVPREANVEADDLANGRTDAFDPMKRINIDLAAQNWLVLNGLLEAGQQYDNERRARQTLPRAQAPKRVKRMGQSFRFTDPW